MKAAAVTLLALCAAGVADAQWTRHPDPLIPRTGTGEPDLTAPAPRTADGKPDLSGAWMNDAEPLPAGVQTVEGDLPFPRYMFNVLADVPPEAVEMTPSAAATFAQRGAEHGIDSPTAHCRPTGLPMLTSIMLPYKIVQTPDLVLVLYEENTEFRQILLDGRKPVEGALPRYMGYSTGHWEGNELVVETTGINDATWLDGMGHPHTADMRLIERFRRVDAGHLEIEVTIDDPAAYPKGITYTVAATAMADDDLLEYFCSDNEKSSEHYQ